MDRLVGHLSVVTCEIDAEVAENERYRNVSPVRSNKVNARVNNVYATAVEKWGDVSLSIRCAAPSLVTR